MIEVIYQQQGLLAIREMHEFKDCLHQVLRLEEQL